MYYSALPRTGLVVRASSVVCGSQLQPSVCGQALCLLVCELP